MTGGRIEDMAAANRNTILKTKAGQSRRSMPPMSMLGSGTEDGFSTEITSTLKSKLGTPVPMISIVIAPMFAKSAPVPPPTVKLANGIKKVW